MSFKPLEQGDPRLRQACKQLTKKELTQKNQQAEVSRLLEYVGGRGNKSVPGVSPDRTRPRVVGLSANQVGVMKRISIVDLAIGKRGYYDTFVLINPKIVWRSKSTLERVEGCVNFTTIWGKTKRSKTVKVEALDRSGNEISLKLTGWPAILLQHEVDHLNGHLFIDRLVDPERADLVAPSEFAAYKKTKEDWPKTIDVSHHIVADTTAKREASELSN